LLGGSAMAPFFWRQPSRPTARLLVALVLSAVFFTRAATLAHAQGSWNDQDIGNVGAAGSATISGGVYTIQGAGADIWGSADAFNFVSQPVSGDTELVARINSLLDTHTFAKAGLMFRETLNSGSTDVILDVRPGGGLEFMTRTSTGDVTTFIAGGTQPFAAWLKLTRTGSTFTGFASSNGSDWTLIGSTSVTMAANVSAGLAVTSHTTGVLTTAVFDNVSVIPLVGGALPLPWQHQDVGTVNLGGSAADDSGLFTVQGAGSDIWGTADSFQFVYQPTSGDIQITARVIDLANATNGHAKAGVMLRGALADVAADVIADIQPDGSIEFMSRSSNGGDTTFLAGAPTQLFPAWLRLTLSGPTVTASLSPNGQVWTVIGSTAVTGMTEAGLAVTSHDASTFATATFDNVTVTTGTGQPPPSPWANQDVGIVDLDGSAAYSAGAFTISAAGADIWGTADSFNFTSQPFSGDGQIVARVTRPENTNTFAKAGVMFRETLTAGSIEVVLDLRPTGDIEFMTRATTGGATSFIAGSTTATSQIWLALARSGGTFTAFKSTDGVTWMQIGATSVTMADTANVGLAVTSHNTATRTTASIDSVSVTSSGARVLLLPRTPSAPTPASAATNVSTTPTLTWSDSGATSYDVAFGTTNPPPTVSTGQSSPSYTPATLANETTYYWQIVAHNANGTAFGPLWLFTTVAANGGGGLPAPWADQDVGSVGSTGTASYASGAFIVTGAGGDIGGTGDAFNCLYRPLIGDGQITARITAVQSTNAAATAGVMLRETLNPDAASVLIDLRPSGALEVLARTSTGSTTINLVAEPELISFPMWVRLARSGSTVVAYVSQEGGSWTAVATTTVSMASSVDVGLAVTSATTSALTAGIFDNVSVGAVSIPAPPALSFARKVLATGGAGSGTAIGITGFEAPTSVTLGPDGKLYVATVVGRIYILTLDPMTLMQPGQASVTHVQEIDTIYLKPSVICDSTGANCQLQGGSTGRQVTGIAIDPSSTSTDITLYVSNSNLGQNGTDITVYTYSGTITRLVLQPDAGNPGNYLVVSNQDLVSGLPRSRESHSVNGLSIGPDGWLYLAVGGNTNAGAPSESFLDLPEYYLSASVVRLNLAALPAGLPIDVTNVRAASDMSPWQGLFELYATGYRNPYDLVWHSNGRLYLNVNNSNLTEGPTPGPNDGCSSTPSIDIGTPPDVLVVVTQGAHGGHPNPQRGQCVWGDGTTHYWPDGTLYNPALPADAGYTPPIAEYVRDAGDSTDGIVEYKSNAFGGAMQHNLISASFDGDDNIRRIVLTPDGRAVQAIYLLGQFDQPLDVWTDVTGNIYVVEFGSNQITMLIPAQPGS
jgi:regulation of enolase protein 1 (concanavalin A-like superfamily)